MTRELLEVAALDDNHLAIRINRDVMQKWLRAVARSAGRRGRVPEEIGWAVALRDPLLTLGRGAIRRGLAIADEAGGATVRRTGGAAADEARGAPPRPIFWVWLEGEEVRFRVAKVGQEEVDAQVVASILLELETALDRRRLREALAKEMAWDRPIDARRVH